MIRKGARLAWRAAVRFFDHNGPDRAAAVAYYALLSLMPLLIFMASIGAALMGSFDEAYRGTLLYFRGVVIHLDQRALDELRSFVQRAQRFQWGGLLLLAWTARRAFASLFAALEGVFQAPGRGFAKGNLVAFAAVMVTGAGLLMTLVLVPFSAALEGVLRRLAGPGSALVLKTLTGVLLTRVLPPLLTISFFFLLYRIAPRRVVTTSDAAIGALLATLLWEGAKELFAYYVRNLAQYGGLYGALEAVIVLALWLELSVSIILYCGELVALRVHARQMAHAPVRLGNFAVDRPAAGA